MKHGRLASRLVLLAGAAGIGLFLFKANPREVTLVYALDPGAPVRELRVDVDRNDERLRHADFRFPKGAPEQVRHVVRLPDGDYTVRATIVRDGKTVDESKELRVSESGTVVLPL